MMEIAFHFMLKVRFILEIFTFLSSIFDYGEKRLDKKTMINFNMYDVTDWITNNYKTQIAQ